MASKFRDFIPMYGAGPVYGARPVSPHPYRSTSVEARNAIHPCGAYAYLDGAILVNTSSVLYRYGRGTEVVTEADLEASPYFFKGDFTRIPQKMIQFWQQTRHPVDFSFDNPVATESHSVDIEDQVAVYNYGPEYISEEEGTMVLANPPDGNGGEYPVELDPTPEYLDELAWRFNNQNRSWNPEGVPWSSPVYGHPEEFRLGHRHAGWAWKLCQTPDTYARSSLGGRGSTIGTPLGISFSANMRWTHAEGVEASGVIDTGESWDPEIGESVPLLVHWSSRSNRKRSTFSVLLRPRLVYLSHFGYWHFACFYDQESSNVCDISFGPNLLPEILLPELGGDIELLQAYLDTCQEKAEEYYGSNPSFYYRSLPEFDFDVRANTYGPDPDSITTLVYGALTGLWTDAYEWIYVHSEDPNLIIEGTFDWHFAWERCVHVGQPSQDSPTSGNRENFGPVWVHAPSP